MSISFRKASREKIALKIAITGGAGTGKSTAALRLGRGLVGPKGRIGAIDTENGSLSLYSDITDFDVLNVDAPFEPGKFIISLQAAIDEQFDCIIVDSMSHIWESVLADKAARDSRGGNSFSNWAEPSGKWRDALDLILQSKMHVICCLRAKTEYIIEVNEKGKSVPRKVGMAPIARKDTDFEFSVVWDLDHTHTAACSKDRTRLFDGRFIKLDEKVGETLAGWLSGAVEAPKVIETPKVEAPAPVVQAKVEPKPEPKKVESSEKATAQQAANIETLLKQYPLTPDEVSKLFNWLGSDQVPGLEKWSELTQEQAAKAIEFLTKKISAPKPQTPAPTAPVVKTETASDDTCMNWLIANEEKANAFCRKINWIEPTQTVRDLPKDKLESIRSKMGRFAINAGIEVVKN